MNMPSFTGNLVHQIIGDYPADTLEDLRGVMDESDFITVTEVYKDTERRPSTYYTKGPIMLNCMHIGKVKEFIE
jgi:hypothetical protein